MLNGNQLAVVTLLAISATNLLAGEKERPVCNARQVGKFWPAAANEDKAVVERLVRCGGLEMCTRTGAWHYRWQTLSISVAQLRSVHKSSTPPSACSSPSLSQQNTGSLRAMAD